MSVCAKCGNAWRNACANNRMILLDCASCAPISSHGRVIVHARRHARRHAQAGALCGAHAVHDAPAAPVLIRGACGNPCANDTAIGCRTRAATSLFVFFKEIDGWLFGSALVAAGACMSVPTAAVDAAHRARGVRPC